MRMLLASAAAAALLTGCGAGQPACPRLSANDNGSWTIASPAPSSQPDDLAGCEYEFDDEGNLGTERDTDG